MTAIYLVLGSVCPSLSHNTRVSRLCYRLGQWALGGYGQAWHPGQLRGVTLRVTWDVSPTPEQAVWGSRWVRSQGAGTRTQTEGAAVLRAGLGFRVTEVGYIFI